MDEMSEFIECGICNENYNRKSVLPRLLPCQHSVCTTCLSRITKQFRRTLRQIIPKSILKNKKQNEHEHTTTTTNQQLINIDYYLIVCPFCKAEHKIPPTEIPINRMILKYIDEIKNPKETQETNKTKKQKDSFEQMETQFTQLNLVNSKSLDVTFNQNNDGQKPERRERRKWSDNENTSPIISKSMDQSGLDTENLHENDKQQPERRRSKSRRKWDESNNHLQALFNTVDHNKDGLINIVELNTAIETSLEFIKFERVTIIILVNRYDEDNDGQLSFNQFKKLYEFVSKAYFSFRNVNLPDGTLNEKLLLTLLYDYDQYTFNKEFFDFIISNLKRQVSRLDFDIYCRIIARYDDLFEKYNSISYYRSNLLKDYLMKTFFIDFW